MTRWRIVRSSGMQEPQLVPARSFLPMSATVAASPLAIASRMAGRPTPKQAQTMGPVSAAPLLLAPDKIMRRSRSSIAPDSKRPRTTSHCGGACAGPTKMQASSRPARKAADAREAAPLVDIFGNIGVGGHETHYHFAPDCRRLVGRKEKASAAADGLAGEPSPGRQIDWVPRQDETPIGEFDRFDARGRRLQFRLSGIADRIATSPFHRRAHDPPWRRSSESARTASRAAGSVSLRPLGS